jgi:predicted transcriptional regulator
MAKKKASDTGRIPKMVYLPPDIARRLEKAAKDSDLSQSSYMVQALKAQFKKDSIE